MTSRDKFEAWAVRNWFAIHRNGGEQYVNTATQHAWTGWQAAEADRAAWRDTITEALVVAGIYTAQHDIDPRKALADLLAWEVQVALDPAVSKDAAALIARGRRQASEEAVAECERQSRDFYDPRSGPMDGAAACADAIRHRANPEGDLS